MSDGRDDLSAPGVADRSFAALTTWLDDRLATAEVPGAAVGIVIGNQVFTHAYGVQTAGAPTPTSAATTFRVASLTKVFTAAAVARLAHAGRIDIQQPVREILPGFGVADAEASAAVTTAHLLAHSAGWADAIDPDSTHDSLGYYVDRMKDLPQVAPVGRYLSYSNSGYLLAGHLLATVSGREYEAVIHSEVIDPLGLSHTGFPAEDLVFAPAAGGHARGDNGPAPIDAGPSPRAANPAFGLVSSVDDLMTFLQAQLQAEDSSPFASMLTPSGPGGSVGPTVVDAVGMGWMLREVDGHRFAMSQGSDTGYCAAMALAPTDDFAVAVLTNSDAALMLVNDTVWQAAALFLGVTLEPASPVAVDAAHLEAASGRFALWDGMAFEVGQQDGGLVLATTVGGHPLPALAGPLTLTGA
ncbi:MAG: serine hydrolase domain-containing protein, partial [Propionibacteriaceae bacterium]